MRKEALIVAFRKDHSGPYQEFTSVTDATRHLGLHQQSIVRFIMNGERTENGFFLDWSVDASPKKVKKFEESYDKLKLRSKARSQRRHDTDDYL